MKKLEKKYIKKFYFYRTFFGENQKIYKNYKL